MTPAECSNTGLIVLELIGSEKEKNNVVEKLENVEYVSVKLVNMSM